MHRPFGTGFLMVGGVLQRADAVHHAPEARGHDIEQAAHGHQKEDRADGKLDGFGDFQGFEHRDIFAGAGFPAYAPPRHPAKGSAGILRV